MYTSLYPGDGNSHLPDLVCLALLFAKLKRSEPVSSSPFCTMCTHTAPQSGSNDLPAILKATDSIDFRRSRLAYVALIAHIRRKGGHGHEWHCWRNAAVFSVGRVLVFI